MVSHLTFSLLPGAKSLLCSISPSSTKLLQREPAPPGETSHLLCVRSACHGPMESSVRGSVMAGAQLTRHSAAASAFLKHLDTHSLLASSHPGPDSRACSGSSEDAFSDFLYWRTPLPDISKDLERLLSDAGPREQSGGRPETEHGSRVTRSKIQEVLDSLQEHVMTDPDVQGKCCSL